MSNHEQRPTSPELPSGYSETLGKPTRLFRIDRAYPVPNLHPTHTQIQLTSEMEDVFAKRLSREEKEDLVWNVFPLTQDLVRVVDSREYYEKCEEVLEKVKSFEVQKDENGTGQKKSEQMAYDLFAELFNRMLDAATEIRGDRQTDDTKTRIGLHKPRFHVYRPDPADPPGPYARIECIGLFSAVDDDFTGTPTSGSVPGAGDNMKGKHNHDVDSGSETSQALPKWSDQLLTFSVDTSWLALENHVRPISATHKRHHALTSGPVLTLAIYPKMESSPEPRLQFVWRSRDLLVSPAFFFSSDFDLIARALLSVYEKWEEEKLRKNADSFAGMMGEEMGLDAEDVGEMRKKKMTLTELFANQMPGRGPLGLTPFDSLKCEKGCIIGRKSDKCGMRDLRYEGFEDEDEDEAQEPKWMEWMEYGYTVSLLGRGESFRFTQQDGQFLIQMRNEDPENLTTWDWKEVEEVGHTHDEDARKGDRTKDVFGNWGEVFSAPSLIPSMT